MTRVYESECMFLLPKKGIWFTRLLQKRERWSTKGVKRNGVKKFSMHSAEKEIEEEDILLVHLIEINWVGANMKNKNEEISKEKVNKDRKSELLMKNFQLIPKGFNQIT